MQPVWFQLARSEHAHTCVCVCVRARSGGRVCLGAVWATWGRVCVCMCKELHGVKFMFWPVLSTPQQDAAVILSPLPVYSSVEVITLPSAVQHTHTHTHVFLIYRVHIPLKISHQTVFPCTGLMWNSVHLRAPFFI